MTKLAILERDNKAARAVFDATLKVTRADTYCGYRSEVDTGWKHAFIITNKDGSDVTIFQWTYAGGAGGLDVFKHASIADAIAQLRAMFD